ncbi:hypothetical protein [Pseudomonas sp. ZS1P83]
MTTQVAIAKRPFAVEPFTGIMLPDGVFDSAIKEQLISVYIVNTSDMDIQGLWVRTKSTPDYKILAPDEIFLRRGLKKGAATLVQWRADFSTATPGKRSLILEFGGTSTREGGGCFDWDGYADALIFISSTRLNTATNTYTCHVPQGVLTVKFENSEQSPGPVFFDGDRAIQLPSTQFPQRFTCSLTCQPGSELMLPFEDPWWKVIACIVAAIAGIGAILEAAKGHGTAEVGIGGHGHDNPADYEWCAPDPTALGTPTTPAGALSTIANAAILVALADVADPWERGRQHANLVSGEVPVSEQVAVKIKYPAEMQAGTAFEVGVIWHYTAMLSSGRSVELRVEETRLNEHAVTWVLEAPHEITQSDPMFVKARATRADGSAFRSDELYGYAIFTTPGAMQSFQVPLLDDGNGLDDVAADGWFTAGGFIEEFLAKYGPFDPVGEWSIQCFAQNVNDANSTMAPKVAATHIGGVPLIAPVVATRTNGSACKVAELIRVIVKRF